jgi:uncharacterized membrane protein
MATAKKKTATKKTPVKKSASKQPAKTAVVSKLQLPSPITPLLALVSAIFTYYAFSLAIDSGSYWHYIAGFYFFYQAVRLTKLTIKTRMNDDKSRKAPKA